MGTPPVVITNPIENAIAGVTGSPGTANAYFVSSNYNSIPFDTSGGYSMPYDGAVLNTTPTVDVDALIAGDATSTPTTALSHFVTLANVDTATFHRNQGKGDYFENPACNQKRVGSLGSA